MIHEGEAMFEVLQEARRLRTPSEELGWTVPDVGVKLGEEFGEFMEAVQIHRGLLPHKEEQHKYAPVEEAADMIGCMLDILTRLYGDKMSSSEIHILFEYWVDKKLKKWVNRVELDHANRKNESD